MLVYMQEKEGIKHAHKTETNSIQLKVDMKTSGVSEWNIQLKMIIARWLCHLQQQWNR